MWPKQKPETISFLFKQLKQGVNYFKLSFTLNPIKKLLNFIVNTLKFHRLDIGPHTGIMLAQFWYA